MMDAEMPVGRMYGNLMRYVAGQQNDGEVDRREFEPGSVDGWPVIADEGVRKRVESFVLRNISSSHKFLDAAGGTRVVYLDERGRAVDCVIEEVPDAELLRMAKRYGMRFNGEPGVGRNDPKPGVVPETSQDDHGYSRPKTEDADAIFEDILAERGPKMARGKWKMEGDKKSLANEGAAIKAAAAASAASGGKPVKVWEQPDAVAGIKGNRGYSVSVKSITRKGLAG